jgi:hypothetical protein
LIDCGSEIHSDISIVHNGYRFEQIEKGDAWSISLEDLDNAELPVAAWNYPSTGLKWKNIWARIKEINMG